MSINFDDDGKMVAMIKNKKKVKELVFIDSNDQRGIKKIKLHDDDVFIPVLDSENRSIVYICGASGSGKSTFARMLVDNFHTMFPTTPIYMFSRLSSDPAFDDLETKKVLIRIPINNDLIESNIDVVNDIEQGSMVIFDDIDTISDKKIMGVLNNIKLQILEIGRHKKIYCIVTSHLINTNDRNGTRTMMNEMSSLVIFPKGGGSVYQQKYCLKNYLGLSNDQINDILGTSDSRWVLISKNYPQYVLTQKKIYMN